MTDQTEEAPTADQHQEQIVEVHMTRKAAGFLWGALIALTKASPATYAMRRNAARMAQTFSELRRGHSVAATVDMSGPDAELSTTAINRWLALPEHRQAEYTLTVTDTKGKGMGASGPIQIREVSAHALHEACKGQAYEFDDNITRLLYNARPGAKLRVHLPKRDGDEMLLTFTVEMAK